MKFIFFITNAILDKQLEIAGSAAMNAFEQPECIPGG